MVHRNLNLAELRALQPAFEIAHAAGRYHIAVMIWERIDPDGVLLRSGLNNSFIFSTLREARSRLYQRQIFQVNIRWKALDEINKIYMLLHRSDLNISETTHQTCSHFSAKFWKIYPFLQEMLSFAQSLMKFCRNFADIFENVEKS